MIVNTVRFVDYDQLREHIAGDDDTLKKNTAVSLLDGYDYRKLNLNLNLNLKLTSKYGSVITKAREYKGVPEGMILLPVSIWANQITGIENGELIFKNLNVSVEITSDPVLSFEELIKKIKTT